MFRRHDDHPLPPHVGRRVHSPIDFGLDPASVARLPRHFRPPLTTLRRWLMAGAARDHGPVAAMVNEAHLARRHSTCQSTHVLGTTRGHRLALNGMSGWGNSSD